MTKAGLGFEAASARLDARDRHLLALHELGELSYGEIADALDTSDGSVARLMARAWLRLRDELRGGALAAIATRSEYCERALALVAQRSDGEAQDPDDRDWLLAHLACCPACRIREEAMDEARVSYRAWRRTVACTAA